MLSPWSSYQNGSRTYTSFNYDQLDGVAQLLGAAAQALANLPDASASLFNRETADQSARLYTA